MAVKQYTDEQILNRIKSLSNFEGWPTGPMLVAVRSEEDNFNQFDDKGYLYIPGGEGEPPQFVLQPFRITTNPGAGALLKFFRYNKDGAAVMKADYINYDSHFNGRHKRDPNAYRQGKGVPYYRDGNKNRKSEEIGSIFWDIIFMNIHKAGWLSKLIGWWSAGCIVFAIRREWNMFINFLNSIGSPDLTLVVLKEF
jgi:hypothetical protein